MCHLFRHLMFTVLAVLALQSVTSAKAEDCASFNQEIGRAYRSGDAELAARIYRRAQEVPVCTGDALARMGRRISKIFYKVAYQEDVTTNERDRLLEKALKFGRPWQVLAALGDSAKKRRQYARAALYYQEALDDITDELFNPKAPRTKIIARIHARASESRMLAMLEGRYVKTMTTRSGEPGGLARVRFRGFTSRKTAVPIQFATRKATLNKNGIAAVRDMLEFLKKQGAPNILLVGHTDPRGSSKSNKRLSKKRAETVMIWLKKAGYKGRIRTKGLGEDQPFKADDPGSYSKEERWQLDRRVELVRE
jgi:outer membrane protein OmpA-like peptidoglycan-associated protein